MSLCSVMYCCDVLLYVVGTDTALVSMFSDVLLYVVGTDTAFVSMFSDVLL